MVQAAIAADSRRYNVFTFLEDEGVNDVITSGDQVTPDVEAAVTADDANGGSEAEPLVAATETSANGLVTSSPKQLSEDVADLEFRGNS